MATTVYETDNRVSALSETTAFVNSFVDLVHLTSRFNHCA